MWRITRCGDDVWTTKSSNNRVNEHQHVLQSRCLVHSNTCDIGMVHVLSLPNSLFASHTHNYFTLHGPPHPGYSLTVNKCTSLLSLASRSWHPLCLLLQFLQLFKRAAIVVTSMIITSDMALQVLSMVANSAKISEKPERVQMINQHTP